MSSSTTSFLTYQNQSDFDFPYVQGLSGEMMPKPQVPFDERDVTVEFTKIVNLKSIESTKYSLRKPIPLLISKEGGEYRAELQPLEIVAFGSSIPEVVAEVSEEVADLCEVIFSHTSVELGQSPKAWKNVLSGFVVSKA